MGKSEAALVAFALAAGFLGLAVYFWRRCQQFYTLLVEGAARYEELRLRCEHLDGERRRLETYSNQLSTSEERQRQQALQGASRIAELQQTIDQKAGEEAARLRNLELQKNHLIKTNENLEKKLAEKDETIDEVRQQLEYAKDEAQRGRREVQETQAKLRDAEQRQERLREVDPRELQDAKRRAAQYERLYLSMRSLREMTEERNKNWETALGRMASWILQKQPPESGKDRSPTIPTATTNIGPLVGEALATIGAELVEGGEEDSHTDA